MNLSKIPRNEMTRLKTKMTKLFAKADSLIGKLLFCPLVKFAEFNSGWCGNGKVVGFCSKTVSKKTHDVLDIYFTGCCWNISNSCFESKYQNQREGKVGPSQNFNSRSCKSSTLKLLLLMDLCGIYQRLAVYRYQSCDIFKKFTLKDFLHKV